MKPQDLAQKTKEFFVQEVTVIDRGGDRIPFFVSRLTGRKLLHVGCTDWPELVPDDNLHVELSRHVGELIGCDPDTAGIEQLKSLCGGRYYLSLAEVLASKESFDVALAPEVLEHTPNPGQFLQEFFKIPAAERVLTVPSFSYSNRAEYKDDVFYELVHPDHKAWYSPYTLWNSCLPFLSETDDAELFFLDNRATIGIWVRS